MDSLPAEPQRKPKNTGVGSLSLLQRIFLNQESNRGLLHFRQILYQLSYQGRHVASNVTFKTDIQVNSHLPLRKTCYLKEIFSLKNPIILNVKSESESRSVMSNSLWHHGLYSPWNSSGQHTRVGTLSLLQGIFQAQGLNPGFPTLQADSLSPEPQGSPRLLEWIIYPFSSGSSRLSNQTRASCVVPHKNIKCFS